MGFIGNQTISDLFNKQIPCCHSSVCSVIDNKIKEVAHEPQASVSLMFLPHFDVFCDLLC